jgi:hypothetical protein
MILGATLLLALSAAALGTLVWWLAQRVGAPPWLAFWLGLTVALFVMASGPIRIG